MNNEKFKQAADLILEAYRTGEYCTPVRELIGETIGAGYAVQSIVTERWLQEGRRLCGRKIGLTSEAVQIQLGVDQPDFGVLMADMEYADGSEIPCSEMQQAKAEAELALVLKSDLDHEGISYEELVGAIDYILPAIEIVGSRIMNWNIRLSDTVADNASSGLYVLGRQVHDWQDIDLAASAMVLKCNGEIVSEGVGAACLGHPFKAALWLANTCARFGNGLRAGDVVLTGAMGPMVPITPGDRFEASIENVGSVHFTAGPDQ
ncbi:2-keto-4-pentenoate hydratase [Emcibacter sp.]|uniref:2-keto-4-pentenoate hydratase n=1 Tax=Emcibacter sp. TaxID=1979954 RepID=UPI002AA630DE|nr:fumarylacetoacetate hydrolase family protein [Emcibacter sp.]